MALEQHWFAFAKHRKPSKRPALACDGRRANLKSRREREWEVKNEEQNKSMSAAAEGELTTVCRAVHHFNFCPKFQDIFLSVYFGSNLFFPARFTF